MPQSIPAGLTRDHVLQALRDLDGGMEHPFGSPTGYQLVHEGRAYAPKAVVGLAYRHYKGRILGPGEFSGGEAPGQANFVLRRLGFTVLSKSDEPVSEPQTGRDWSQVEVAALVADYFAMLEKELSGQPYSKAEHRKALEALLPGRSKGSIEFKHQNVSGVLVERGLPYIEGYKPRMNYQTILAEEIEAFLDQRPGYLDQYAEAPVPTATGADLDPERVIEAPPETVASPRREEKPWLARTPRKGIDFAERDAQNRQLGTAAEEFVFNLERHRLRLAGRDDLAGKVVWAAREIGDGLGFDIISFDEADESERMLEVKATALGKHFPFYVTSNEVRCSDDIPEQYQLFRVFTFVRNPRIYILHGSLRSLCQLEPVLYRASVGN